MSEITKFSDIEVPSLYEGTERIRFRDLVGKEIIVKDVTFLLGDFGEYAVFEFQFLGDEKRYSTSTGAKIVMFRLRNLHSTGKLPAQGKVVKEGRHYDII